jgi:hypothetical protein
MRRFYAPDVKPDLFRHPAVAEEGVQRLRRTKERRGMRERLKPDDHLLIRTAWTHRVKLSKKDIMSKTPRQPKAVTKGRKRAAKAKKSMSLAVLAEGMPGLSSALGQVLAEAAAVCLENRQHQSGVRLQRTGLMREDLHVEWEPVDDQRRRGHADMKEATERGACGVAILVVKEATGMVVIERSIKGTGFDYWIGEKDDDQMLFEGTARLEVSGILTGTRAQIDSRLKQKKDQIKPTDHLASGLVAVVEFGTPIACVERK